MSEQLQEQENQLDEVQDMQPNDDVQPSDDVQPNDDVQANDGSSKKRNPKLLIILGGIAVAAVAIAFIFLHESEFEKVCNECVHIAGQIGGGADHGYFTIDTYPDYYEDMDESTVAFLVPNTQKNALKAIRHANEKLGFSDFVYSKMMETTALMGRQSEENDKYKVSWTYHPDDGLEVTYEKK